MLFILSVDLYKQCDVVPLTERVERSKWTMLGHALRLSENGPAALALTYALDGCPAKSRSGRH